MRLEAFFENFELLAETPNGVQKLRELILQLAVMGKVVPQDPNDEPASVLLEKIKLERKELIKDGKISKSKPLPSVQSNDIPGYELPSGWEWCRFGQVMDCYRGHNPPKDKFVEHPQDGYVRFIQITDFKTNEKAVYVPISKNLKYINKGEIAMAAYRHIGKLSRDVEGAFNVAICKVMEIPPMSLDFIEKLIGSDFVKGELLKASGRAHIPSMHTEHLLSLIIPLPPLKEQHRIVTKVDQLMSLCDELEARQQKKRETRIFLNNVAINQLLTAPEPDTFAKHWQRICDNFDLFYSAPENIGKLRQIILQLAVIGKLVPQDPNDEPASVLLEKIKLERKELIKDGKISKSKPLPSVQSNDIPGYELPSGWEWCRFGQVMDCYRGHNPPKDKFVEHPQDGYVRFIQITDFKTNEKAVYVPISKNLKYINKGEIAMAAYRHIGKLSRDVEGAFNVAICKVMEIPPMSLDFIEKLIGSDFVKGELLKASGRAHIPSMHTEHLLSLIIPLPPLKEQHRIVAKVDQLISLCDELEAKLTQSQTDSEKLMDAAVRQLLVV